MTQEMITTEVT